MGMERHGRHSTHMKAVRAQPRRPGGLGCMATGGRPLCTHTNQEPGPGMAGGTWQLAWQQGRARARGGGRGGGAPHRVAGRCGLGLAAGWHGAGGRVAARAGHTERGGRRGGRGMAGGQAAAVARRRWLHGAPAAPCQRHMQAARAVRPGRPGAVARMSMQRRQVDGVPRGGGNAAAMPAEGRQRCWLIAVWLGVWRRLGRKRACAHSGGGGGGGGAALAEVAAEARGVVAAVLLVLLARGGYQAAVKAWRVNGN